MMKPTHEEQLARLRRRADRERRGRLQAEGILEQKFRELYVANRELGRLANEDSLTGIYNRRAFDELASALLERARIDNEQLCVAVFDLDAFKSLNDTAGHVAGDAALRRFAQILQSAVRIGDLVARIGGDEFVVLLRSVGSAAATPVLQRIIDAVQTDVTLHPMTVSAGLAMRSDRLFDLHALVRAADAAMYEAKRLGRNRLCAAAD